MSEAGDTARPRTSRHTLLARARRVWRSRLDRLLRRALPAVPAVVLVIAIALSLGQPMRKIVTGEAFTPNPRVAAATEVMAMIPHGASVETNRGLITHLVSDHRVYWVGTVGDAVPDYVLFDTSTGNDGDIVAKSERKHPGIRYQLIYDHDGYRLAQRVG